MDPQRLKGRLQHREAMGLGPKNDNVIGGSSRTVAGSTRADSVDAAGKPTAFAHGGRAKGHAKNFAKGGAVKMTAAKWEKSDADKKADAKGAKGFARGGAAKIRKGEMTRGGTPIKPSHVGPKEVF